MVTNLKEISDSNKIYTKKSCENVSFKSDSFNKSQPKKRSMEDLKQVQLNLREKISEKLKTETDPKKIKKLKNLQKTLDILLQKEMIKSSVVPRKLAFKGYLEKKAAQKIVHEHSVIASGIGAALAQVPFGDEAVLFANDMTMASRISNVYNLHPGIDEVTSAMTALVANKVGVAAFTKFFTIIPGFGNGLNASIAFGVTEAVGHAFVELCERGHFR